MALRISDAFEVHSKLYYVTDDKFMDKVVLQMILLVSSMCGSSEFLKNFNKILPQQCKSNMHHYLGYNSTFNSNRRM